MFLKLSIFKVDGGFLPKFSISSVGTFQIVYLSTVPFIHTISGPIRSRNILHTGRKNGLLQQRDPRHNSGVLRLLHHSPAFPDFRDDPGQILHQNRDDVRLAGLGGIHHFGNVRITALLYDLEDSLRVLRSQKLSGMGVERHLFG